MENIETLLAAVAQTQGFDDDEPAPKLDNSASSPEIREDVGGSQIAEAPPEVSEDAQPEAAVVNPPLEMAVPEPIQVIGTSEKRKRGRPPKGKGQLVPKPPPPKRRKQQEEDEEEEDVCFICFDGGSLVLCDRKGCPKAYHPACIKRDERYFRSKSKWNCGWHICSVCQKTSYYMCYTCPYSLCKGCTKEEGYLRIRGNKGFCTTCMKTIMLIENKDHASNDSGVQVDFDDITSWEYLFKMYWVTLKEKLSLTMKELTNAKKPWKGEAPVVCRPQFSNLHRAVGNGMVSIPTRVSEHLEMSKLQIVHNDRLTAAYSTIDGQIGKLNYNSAEKAPILSKASQSNYTIDHIQMPKFESHILVKEKNSFTTAGFVGSFASDMDVDGNNFNQSMELKCTNEESCKKHEERSTRNNSSKYAAINVRNMNLIYLRRKLLENLIEDKNFQDKVVGSIVRIRISSDDQKPDVYRLVQVVGMCKVALPYKIGDKMTNNTLEVLNLGKKEVVSVDAISNQEFTEAECSQLDQYIRCGLLKQYTLDDVQRKAMALQSVRFNDWLEAETSRLYHLLDQASKKGCEEEVGEYVRKIQLLKSPEERVRRTSEVPEIQADAETGPNYELEDANGNAEHASPRHSGSRLNEKKPVSPNEKGKEEGCIETQSKRVENIDTGGSYGLEKHTNQVNITNSATSGRSDQAIRSDLEASTATVSIENSPTDNIGIKKFWHYRDSNGTVQGPYSMMHLHLWSTTGLLLPDTRIWTSNEQYNSLLLTDALNGKFHGALELPPNRSAGLQEYSGTRGIEGNTAVNRNDGDSKQTDAARGNNASVSSDNNSGSTRADEASWPKCWDLLKDKGSSAHDVPEYNSIPLLTTDLVQENNDINHVTEKNSSGPTQKETTSGYELRNKTTHLSLASQSSEQKSTPFPIGLSLNDIEPASITEPVSKSPKLIKQEVDIDVTNLPSPKQSRVPTAEKQQSESSHFPMQNSGFLELLSPKPRCDSEDQESQAVETKQSVPVSFPGPNSGPSWSSALNIMVGGAQLPDVANDWCGYSTGLISASSSKPPEIASQNIAASDSNQFAHVLPPHPASNTSWLAMLNEPIEFDALGEDSISDLLAECEMEPQRTLPSPTSAAKFAKELIQDCKDDCFSSIEDFNPGKSDALSSSGEIQLSHQSSFPCKPVGQSLIDALDSFSKSGIHSSGSSAGETNTPVFTGEASSEFHLPPPNLSQDMMGGTEAADPSWGTVQGNINLVTVQGNVNLVLGGPQGMTNLGWGTNQGTAWGNPSMNHSQVSGSLPWDGQRKYTGERFASGREWGYQGADQGFGRGRQPWVRPPFGGGIGGYSRPLPKGQRVCKFYESGRCKKGAFCDYLHP